MRFRDARAAAALALALAPGIAASQSADLRKYEKWAILPSETEVAVDGSVRLRLVQKCEPVPSDELLTPLCFGHKLDTRGMAIAWKVNGENAGSPETGYVRAAKDRYHNGGDITQDWQATEVVYVAPAKAPRVNPVDVTAVIGMDRKEQIQLNARIRVVETPGWRGDIYMEFEGTDDPYNVLARKSVNDLQEVARQNDREARANDPNYVADDRVKWAPEKDEFDLARDELMDLVTVRTTAKFTVVGVFSETYDDDGSGVVVLKTRPAGTFDYLRYVQNDCGAGERTAAIGEPVPVNDGAPVLITLRVRADMTPVVAYVPNIPFALSGETRAWSCDDAEPTRPFESTFDGAVVPGDLVGAPGDGRSFIGGAQVPLEMRIHGRDVPGAARVSWSLSRKR